MITRGTPIDGKTHIFQRLFRPDVFHGPGHPAWHDGGVHRSADVWGDLSCGRIRSVVFESFLYDPYGGFLE